MRHYGVSERRACCILGQPRGTQGYRPMLRLHENLLTQRIVSLACQYGRYGYRRITVMVNRSGLRVSRDRLWLNDGSCIRVRPEHPNHVWSYDFVTTWTHDGRPSRLLCLIDEYTREALAIWGERGMSAQAVIETQADVMLMHGIPEHIGLDNGPEFTAKALRA